jgi:cytidylate kinase
MYRVLTVSREFGSGGATIAEVVAGRLGWRLLDKSLVDDIAARAQVDPALARNHDERIDSWVHRISRRGLWSGALEGAAPVASDDVFDCETMASLTRTLIEDAYAQGSCVIVGRGAQCILQNRPDVFHVFIYAPLREKIERVKARLPGVRDPQDLIRSTERTRADFIKLHYGYDWTNPHLYDAMCCVRAGVKTRSRA